MACLFAGDKSLMATELSGMVKLQRNLNRHLSNSNLLCSLYDAVCSFIGAGKYQAGKSQIVSQTQGTVFFCLLRDVWPKLEVGGSNRFFFHPTS
jgi:hypothetical protein